MSASSVASFSEEIVEIQGRNLGNCVNANLNKFWECLKVQMWGVITQQQKSVKKC